MNWNMDSFASNALWGVVLLLAWSLSWKGLALWHAARRSEKGWYVVLLIVNTVGVLEIIYLTFIAKIFASPKRTSAKK